MTLDVQVMTMIAMTIGGVYIGFALETYRRLARSFRNYRILVYLFEILFWVSQTAILFFILYKVNHGELRFYVFLACLLGYSIYNVICKTVYQKVLEGLITAVKTIFGWIVQAVNALFIQPILGIFRLLLKLLRFMWRLILLLLYYPAKFLTFIAKKILPESFFKKISNFYVFCSTMIYKLTKKMKKTIGKWR